MHVTLSHEEVDALLGAWALDACDPAEARGVELHLHGCATCMREASRLHRAAAHLATIVPPVPAPPTLLERILDAAAAPASSTPAQLLSHQTDALGALLGDLRRDEWDRPTAAGWTVHELLAHLVAGASYLTWQLGLTTDDPGHHEGTWLPRSERVIAGERLVDPAQTAALWRLHESLLFLEVHEADHDRLMTPVPWFGGEMPLQALAIVHAFETWIHAEDMRAATGRPPAEPATPDLATMSGLAGELLAAALDETLRDRDRSVQLILDGPGGGTWTFPTGATDVSATVRADVVDFCRLVGGRIAPDSLVCERAGDDEAAGTVLAAAASFAFP
jgi:uncharacterized protein (TIGR03083 family)